MKTTLLSLGILLLFNNLQAQPVLVPPYSPPTGGWLYTFDGSSGDPGSGAPGAFDALDGTWSHDNGSDAYDGSFLAPGAGAPGGIIANAGPVNNPGEPFAVGSFLRVQETGDPRDYGMPDPSNRKIYLGHDLSAAGAPGNLLDAGVTLYFRARVPTSGPLDMLRPDGGAGEQPYPADGDGYLIHDGGKGNFGVKQADGGIISFSLTTFGDTGGLGEGLIMNNLNGTAISGNVDSGEAGMLNMLSLDPTLWHDYWVTINGGGSGTHQVNIYIDGSLVPMTFDVTAGNGSDFSGISYIAMGVGSTGQSGAFDLDFFSVASGAFAPVPEPSTWALLGLGAMGFLVMCRRRR